MFSGIIAARGKTTDCPEREGGLELRLQTPFIDLAPGESVAVNGVCLTVEKLLSSGGAVFWISPETLARTALGRLQHQSLVNLERALALGDRFSGHIVQGHVDGIGLYLGSRQMGDARYVRIFLPDIMRPYLVEKGSVAIDGVSLTVNEIGGHGIIAGEPGFAIGLMIIPHTWSHTAFETLEAGCPVNIEVDVMGKYVENMMRFADLRPALPNTLRVLPLGLNSQTADAGRPVIQALRLAKNTDSFSPIPSQASHP